MYCYNCGKQVSDSDNFCQGCGVPIIRQQVNQCPRCGSPNVQFQTKQAKVGCAAFMGAFGTMLIGLGIFGPIGAIVGLVVGAIVIGLILLLVPTPTETFMVCQQCGYTSKPIKQKK